MEINQTVTPLELQECHLISTFGNYQIYQADEDVQYLFAIDNDNLICSCFEFVEYEDYVQLAHMYTIPSLIGQGIGKQILREAVDIYGTFELPSTDYNKKYYFINKGLDWINDCFDCGILTYPSFRRP